MAVPKGARYSSQYRNSVFLNFPYDEQFQDLFLAYVVGVCSFGLTPRTTLEIVGGEQRLRRIAGLIQSCKFSFHDLSRIEVSDVAPATPRFNMPFEAGLAVMCSLIKPSAGHTYFIFEAEQKRLQKSLSDLGGADVYAHEGTAEGVLREISNALIASKYRPTVAEMMDFFNDVRAGFGDILWNAKAKTPYSARVFAELVVVTNEMITRNRQTGAGGPKSINSK